MKRYLIRSIATICMWIGGTEIAASFLSKMMFHYQVEGTPYFFALLLFGILLYIGVKIIG